MSVLNCPYCEIKGLAKVKTVFSALKPVNGKCPDCGAYIDIGQHSVEMNCYEDIYKGALQLLGGMVEEFNEILAQCGIDFGDYIDTEDGTIEMRLHVTDILERLFVPYYGGTTKDNLKKALGITENDIVWKISKDEVEDE